jgi:hypothetical protein
MGGTTAKLVEAPVFEGRNIAATLPRAEVEQAIAGKGDVSLKLEVEARPDGAADFEAHTLEIGWNRDDLKRLLKESSGDQVTLTFDARELADVIDPDVEGQALRERVAVLTVAVAAATAGTAGYVATTAAHHESTSPSYAYVHSTAPIEQVSDAASGGGYQAAASEQGDVVSRAVANQEATTVQGADQYAGYQHATAPTPEQVSDAASGGGYTADTVQGAEQYAGYQHATAPTPEVTSDAASGGGYTQAAASEQGDVIGRAVANEEATTVQGAAQYAGYQHATAPAPEVTSDAASGGGYTAPAPEVTSDAASGGGYQADTAGVASGSKTADVHNVVTDAGSTGPELISDAATGGFRAPTATPADTGGSTFDAPAAPGVIAGGIALLITGAAFATGKARMRKAHPA